MEQKQLDELEESSFGEEFIDDDLDFVAEDEDKTVAKFSSRKEVKKEAKEPKKSEDKKNSKKAVTKSARVAAKKSYPEESDDGGEVHIFPAKEELPKNEPKLESAKRVRELKTTEISPSVNPLGESSSEMGLFKDVSTWKAITGIVIILLLLSVFTQGFRFTPEKGNSISRAQAEERALTFVNTQLLQPPFEAEIASSEEIQDLYKITITVAGQSVDSYITKDGSLFFPQGFETGKNGDTPPAKIPAKTEPASLPDSSVQDSSEEPLKETTADTGLNTEIEEEVAVADTALPVEAEKPATSSTAIRQATLKYYKWTFSPLTLTAKRGETVRLTLMPDGSKPASLQLNRFTFEIPELGVRQEIAGTTKAEFIASKAGKFRFLCSSCRDSPGVMEGELVVE